MGSTCWKCGKKLGGLRASQLLGICPECEILEKISKGQNSVSPHSFGGNAADIIIDKYMYEYDSAPMWWRKAVRPPKSKENAAWCAFFVGCWGGHWLYIGRAWASLFFVHAILMVFLLKTNMQMFVLIAPLLNVLFCAFFAVFDEDTFLKTFFPDMWKDKRIADQYGTMDNDFREIPDRKPTWEDAFQTEKTDVTQCGDKPAIRLTRADVVKPPVRMKATGRR